MEWKSERVSIMYVLLGSASKFHNSEGTVLEKSKKTNVGRGQGIKEEEEEKEEDGKGI